MSQIPVTNETIQSKVNVPRGTHPKARGTDQSKKASWRLLLLLTQVIKIKWFDGGKEAGNVFCSMNKWKWQWQGLDHMKLWIINAVISIQKLWITELVLTQKGLWWQEVFFFSFYDSSKTINNTDEVQSHCCWSCKRLACLWPHAEEQCWSSTVQSWGGWGSASMQVNECVTLSGTLLQLPDYNQI